MVFLFGNKDYFDLLGYIKMKCPRCKAQRIFSVKQERKKLTVYFIPTIQFLSRKIMICETCKETFEVNDELKSKVAENLISQEELDSLKRRGKPKIPLASPQKRLNKLGIKPQCLVCGSHINKSMRYCPQCGNKL
jgi:predicted RNA-binding Zn-ribbon protein involved in translation (DUF1610 family)